jgi:hypothetical protein
MAQHCSAFINALYLVTTPCTLGEIRAEIKLRTRRVYTSRSCVVIGRNSGAEIILRSQRMQLCSAERSVDPGNPLQGRDCWVPAILFLSSAVMTNITLILQSDFTSHTKSELGLLIRRGKQRLFPDSTQWLCNTHLSFWLPVDTVFSTRRVASP